MRSNSYKISIIVPVFNSAKYLDKCLESLKKQTYQNIEILIVDNGSTDESLKICDFYAQKDERFQILHCNQRGASSARNEGLKKVSGYYVMYVDSDDYVNENYCKFMVETIEKSKATLVVCGITLIAEDGRIIQERNCFYANKTNINESEKIVEQLYKTELLNSLFNKIYLYKEIKEMFDPLFKIGEDLLFNIKYLDNKNAKICCIKENLYYYRIFPYLSETKLMYYADGRLQSILKLYSATKSFADKYGFSNVFFQDLIDTYASNIIFCIKEWGEVRYKKVEMISKIEEMVNDKTVRFIAEYAIVSEKCKKILLFCIIYKKIDFLYLALMGYGKAKALYKNCKILLKI